MLQTPNVATTIAETDIRYKDHIIFNEATKRLEYGKQSR